MNHKHPKVSILMPSLNSRAYIRECLESVVKQTLRDIEIICVDAGSTDGTLEILREYEGNDPRIRVIVSDNAAYYLDYPYGTIDVRRICESPRIPAYAEGMKDRVLGIECPLWTERITNAKRAAWMLFPRMTAVGLKAGADPAPT